MPEGATCIFFIAFSKPIDRYKQQTNVNKNVYDVPDYLDMLADYQTDNGR